MTTVNIPINGNWTKVAGQIFSNPNTIATNNAVVKLSTCTPGIKFEISKTKAAVIIILISRFIFF